MSRRRRQRFQLRYAIHAAQGALLFRQTKQSNGRAKPLEWTGRLPPGRYKVTVDSPAGAAPWRREFEVEVRATEANKIDVSPARRK